MLSNESKELLYKLTKTRLGRLAPDADLDALVNLYVDSAVAQLESEGISLTDDANDLTIVIDLAVHKYNRRDKDAPMPEALRWEIQDRWLKA